MQQHLASVLQALFVVFLWATSWVLIKIGLQDIPPVTFAGLRYFLAFICLLIFAVLKGLGKGISKLSSSNWLRLIVLGSLFYAVTQGAVFVALAHLPAVTVNLLWSFSTVLVAVMGAVWLAERPSAFQWLGIVLALLGAGLYFHPVDIPHSQSIGILAAIIGILANSYSSILGRDVNRSAMIPPLIVTVVSMGAGSLLLLGAGIAVEGLPAINLQTGGIILWLALVNTAFAFTLWNHTLRTLSAVESSIINGTMMIWIPVLAFLFLGETITSKEVLGLLVTGIGTLAVQLRKPAVDKDR